MKTTDTLKELYYHSSLQFQWKVPFEELSPKQIETLNKIASHQTEKTYKYDSRADTHDHINRVRELISECTKELTRRALVHDKSKLKNPEKELFDEYTPKLKECTYGSDEYKEYLKGLRVALDHHYANNSHHPEHYEDGVNGFDLFDLIEMFMDWKAATERHADGDIRKSIEINKERFNLSDQVCDIFRNTVDRIGW